MNMTDEIFSLIDAEAARQLDTLMLIPSENYASRAVREAAGSILCNKYSEGYPGRRYYEGNEIIDQIETETTERAKKIFGVPYANVQPYSGSPANSEILFALAVPGSTIMGLKLASGGHLTHGHPNVTFSGKYYRSVQFGLTVDGQIDYEEMREKALLEKPSVIILGTTAHPFMLDWQKAREIADEVGAYLVADISHIAGLIIAGVHPSPVSYAHVIMTTTHKTLRGPRGAMILVTDAGLKKDSELPKKIDMAVIPGMQGGPHNHTTAAIGIALGEAATAEFTAYGKQIVANARALANALKKKGIQLVGGGTQNHLIVMDFASTGEGQGVLVAKAMNAAGLVANFNTVPSDTSPFYPSGVRIGTPAVTTRGMKETEMEQIADWIAQVVNHVKHIHVPTEKKERAAFVQQFAWDVKMDAFLLNIAKEVRALCAQFPVEREV
ncbi:serine hydroxymethyltransferase [Candidatus Cerribacteria bacterium 'Amazon FNV 2010 28 9']|uniref:Serine hydroxymethyltransferase n=1 Tax=Candidatus Cerribacteria bacterium 'Amazon FNV 2010 28 9' TaxID=2081795 RepID=A0A317JQT3_9BACT|nr:MAG: serine hydroxymethyltransferase [Candidatus Cerribacteria bacterium 'Amazon FNV 2010 28 9']